MAADVIDYKLIGDDLQGVIITLDPGEAVMAEACEGDFFYIDPPFEPLSATSSFTGYTAAGFGREEQLRLQREIDRHESAEQSYMDEGVKLLDLAQMDQAVEDRLPILVAGEIVVGDEEFRDALGPVGAHQRLDVIRRAIARLAALDVDDGAERALIRTAATGIERGRQAERALLDGRHLQRRRGARHRWLRAIRRLRE